jgi:hypothetical protein
MQCIFLPPPQTQRSDQGDQIGPILAYGRLFIFGQPLDNCKSSSNFFATFFHRTILTKHVLGYILGDFFTNSSGHPEKEFPSKIFIDYSFTPEILQSSEISSDMVTASVTKLQLALINLGLLRVPYVHMSYIGNVSFQNIQICVIGFL